MASELEMTRVEMEIERSLRSLSPAQASTSTQSATLAFQMGRASMAGGVRRWRWCSGGLAAVVLTGVVLRVTGGASMGTPEDGVRVAAREGAGNVAIDGTINEHIEKTERPDRVLAGGRVSAFGANTAWDDGWARESYDGGQSAGEEHSDRETSQYLFRRGRSTRQNSFDFLVQLIVAGARL